MTELKERSIGRTGAEIGIRTDSGETAGSVVVTQTGDRTKIGYLQVKPAFRGQHFGEALLAAAEDWTVRRDLEEIFGKLEPVPGGEAALLTALRNRGFEIDFKTGIVKKKV